MRLLLAVCMMLAGTPGSEGRWWWLFTEPDGAWFLDAPTLIRDAETRVFWTQIVYRKTRGTVASEMVRFVANCSSRKLVRVETILYTAAGSIVKTVKHDFAEEANKALPPDSIGESVLLIACTEPDRWLDINTMPLQRPPDRVARDIYLLIELGVPEYLAGIMASFDVRKSPDAIERALAFIQDTRLRATLRDMYGLKPETAL